MDPRSAVPGCAGTSTGPADTRPRIHGLDRLKAVAIVTVIWIHGFHTFVFWRSVYEQWSHIVTIWAVPAFFFASGWLHARDTRYPPGTMARWLRRLGIPYVIATLYLTILDAWLSGVPVSLPGLARDLVLGRGIYYFVPVLVFTMIATMPLARSRRAAWIVWALLAPYLFMRARYDPVIWLFGRSWDVILRSPFRWAPYFLTGWVGALLGPATFVRARPVIARTAPVVWLIAIVVVGVGFSGVNAAYWPPWADAVFGVTILAAIATCLCASEKPAGTIVRWLSDATYPIYLYHISFIAIFSRLLRPQTDLQHVELALSTLLATIAFIVAVRRVLGAQRAQTLIG
ncbi:MAG: hypothetical protein B6D46_02935 [Polyangiaceae bacterium UTPRO1]|jgi:peptidoglycan/LPS O-acetylase OafA/YrhL|nr:acyltransferase [Myxococcales bacterium]OQY68616.1 MAG: hypothetical protein B6D46_02935 [Polyangiaceae bacterium UTPRO1]